MEVSNDKFTDREEEVYFTLVEDGVFDLQSIGKKLNITRSTVATHLQRIFLKTYCNSKEQLIYNYWRSKFLATCYTYNKQIDNLCQKINKIEEDN